MYRGALGGKVELHSCKLTIMSLLVMTSATLHTGKSSDLDRLLLAVGEKDDKQIKER